MSWIVPKIWEDGECFIIGGGASIVKQFDIPQDVVNDVVANKLTPVSYSPYLSSLHNRHVIGVNQAFRIGNWIDVIFFGDKGFFLKNQQALAKLTNLRVSCAPYLRDIDWVKYLPKNKEKTKGLTLHPAKVSWNTNSGACAINLAVLMGAKRIILIGFDMNVDEKERQWWHQLYKGRDLHKGEKIFARHMGCFPAIAEDAAKFRIEILNANPNSAIKEFKKVNIKDVL